MPFIDRATRVGRSQGVSIFWGLISVFFAGAACFYYWKNHENEMSADVMRDQVMELREENDTLHSERDHLESSRSDAESQLKMREDLVAEKENELAQEEAQLESVAQQTPADSQQNLAQVPMVRRFNDVIRRLGKDSPPEVVERNGRPVLRIPSGELFAPGSATLKPDGKALLNQITLGINSLITNFELRVIAYTDSDVEADAIAKSGNSAPPAPTHYATSWDLTAARAAALGHYYRDQTTLPFQNVLIVGRGDSDPVEPNDGPNQARNCRVEITITPLPIPFHPPDDSATPAAPAVNAPTPSNIDTDSKPAPPKKKAKLKPKPAEQTPAASPTKDAASSASTSDSSSTSAPAKKTNYSGKTEH